MVPRRTGGSSGRRDPPHAVVDVCTDLRVVPRPFLLLLVRLQDVERLVRIGARAVGGALGCVAIAGIQNAFHGCWVVEAPAAGARGAISRYPRAGSCGVRAGFSWPVAAPGLCRASATTVPAPGQVAQRASGHD